MSDAWVGVASAVTVLCCVALTYWCMIVLVLIGDGFEFGFELVVPVWNLVE